VNFGQVIKDFHKKIQDHQHQNPQVTLGEDAIPVLLIHVQYQYYMNLTIHAYDNMEILLRNPYGRISAALEQQFLVISDSIRDQGNQGFFNADYK